MWKNRLLYFIALIGMCLFFAEYNGWISCFALVLTVLLPILSLLCSIRSKVKEIGISAKSHYPRNEQAYILVSLKTARTSPLCRLAVEITDLMDGRSYREETLVSEKHRKIEFSASHSGRYKIEVIYARVYDLLGLFVFKAKLPAACTVTVDPIALCPEPVPSFDRLQTAYRPIPGGGFSEIHDMREYRPGDPVNTIHWKLSAKTDKLIIREAMEPVRNTVLLTFEPPADRTEMDSVLDQLLWTSRKLVALDITHDVCYFTKSGDTVTETVASTDDLKKMLRHLMSRELVTLDSAPVSGKAPNAVWHYHIIPAGRRDRA